MKMGVFYAPDGEKPPIFHALARIGAEKKNQAAALKLIRIRRNVERAAKDFEEARVALVKQHGREDEATGYRVPPENLTAFVADFNELCEQDVPADMLAETVALADLWRHPDKGEQCEPDERGRRVILIPVAENDIDALGELLVLEDAGIA